MQPVKLTQDQTEEQKLRRPWRNRNGPNDKNPSETRESYIWLHDRGFFTESPDILRLHNESRMGTNAQDDIGETKFFLSALCEDTEEGFMLLDARANLSRGLLLSETSWITHAKADEESSDSVGA